MTARFDNRTAVVLGGTAGIGLATARAFSAEGARVALTGRNVEALARLAAERAWLTLRADMADVAEQRAALARIHATLGPFDILCVNAGVGGFATVPDVTESFWDEVHRVNLRGAFFAVQSALPFLRDGARVVLTGSIGAQLTLAGNVVYAAAKAGLCAVTRTLATELLPRRIRVCMVSPGPVDTEIFKRGATPEQIATFRADIAAKVPMKRLGEPEEVARAILFLASDEASFITGVDLFVDGGCVEL